MSETIADVKQDATAERGLVTSESSQRRDHPSGLRCRFCRAPLTHVFLDLGVSPSCESHLHGGPVEAMERLPPLTVFVCDRCLLVQLPEAQRPESDVAEHLCFASRPSQPQRTQSFCRQLIDRFNLEPHSRVVEVGSGDGSLLEHFKARGMDVLGIEPAAGLAQAAIENGIPTRVESLGREAGRRMADEGISADLLIAGDVLARVPDFNGLVEGLARLLRPGGVLAVEFPHLAKLIASNQFDAISHEHFCYLSLLVVRRVLAAHGLRAFDVDELPTHGGSLRVYACHVDDLRHDHFRLEALAQQELHDGYGSLEAYLSFAQRVDQARHKLVTRGPTRTGD